MKYQRTGKTETDFSVGEKDRYSEPVSMQKMSAGVKMLSPAGYLKEFQRKFFLFDSPKI